MTDSELTTAIAIARADSGMSQEWRESVAKAILETAQAHFDFIVDQLIDHAGYLFVSAKEKNALGAAMRRARKGKVIFHTGEYRPSKISGKHSVMRPVWRLVA